MIENKSLINTSANGLATRVKIDMAQLYRLIDLETDGLPVFYGLPALQPGQLPAPIPPEVFVGRAGWRLRPPFRHWQRMLRPSELMTLPPVRAALMRFQESVTVNTALLLRFQSLAQLLREVLACTEGMRLPEAHPSAGSPLKHPATDDLVDGEMQILRETKWSTSSAILELLSRYKSRLPAVDAFENTVELSAKLHLSRAIWVAMPVAAVGVR